MSIYTNINVTRGTSPVVTLLANQPAQIDNASETLGAYYNQSHPYDLFHVYIEYTTVAFARGDLIIDQFNTDPLTGQKTAYRVAGKPRPYPDGHVELRAEVVTGPEGT